MLEGFNYGTHRESTKENYMAVWRKFNSFVIRLDHKPATWEARTSLYCAYMIDELKLQSSTVKSYVSAIKAKLMADGYDWQDCAVKLSILTGVCKLRNDAFKTRLPIKKNLLEVLLIETKRQLESEYLVLLYQTAFSFAYYGMLRVGELTKSIHAIRAKDVHKGRNKNKLLLVLYSSKTHGRNNKPQKITIEATTEYAKMKRRKLANNTKIFCPFTLAQEYMDLRGGYDTDDEQFFVFLDGTPLTAKMLRTCLRFLLNKLALDGRLYDTHSFRKGRASDMLKEGYTIEQIKKCGRWKSNAVYKYLYD